MPSWLEKSRTAPSEGEPQDAGGTGKFDQVAWLEVLEFGQVLGDDHAFACGGLAVDLVIVAAWWRGGPGCGGGWARAGRRPAGHGCRGRECGRCGRPALLDLPEGG